MTGVVQVHNALKMEKITFQYYLLCGCNNVFQCNKKVSYLGEDQKVCFEWRKYCLQQAFKEKLNLTVFMPRAGGGTVCDTCNYKGSNVLKYEKHGILHDVENSSKIFLHSCIKIHSTLKLST